MIKVGLVGIGFMGNVHFNAYKNLKNAQVIAVADVRVDMAKEKVNDESINIYSSLEELLANEKPDMIDICTPSYLHAEMAIKALESGAHVLCEKPMSTNSTDTEAMIKAYEKSGKLYMTAQVVRFMAPYVYLKKIIDSKELGNPVHIDMRRLSQIPGKSWQDWMKDITKSGGTPIDLSIHDIDFIRYAFGEPKDVTSVYKKLKNENDYIASTFVYDGFSVKATGAWFSCEFPFKAEYLAVFENGYVEYKDGKIIKNQEEVDYEMGAVVDEPDFNATGSDGYQEEIAYFLHCIEKNEKPKLVTPESSQGSVKLVERALKNAIMID